MSLRKLASLTALSLVGVLLTGFGCSTGNGSATGTATMRTVNALVGSLTSVVSFSEGTSTTTPFTTNVPYGAADNAGINGYVSVNAGLGSNFYALYSNNLATSAAYNILPNTTYTLIAFGDYQASPGSGVTPEMIPYQDIFPTTAALGTANAAIRIIHVAPITLSQNSPDKTVSLYSNGAAVSGMTSIAYGSASSYITIPAGTYNLTLRNSSGVAIPLASQTNLSSQSLGVGHAYTLLFVGTDDTGGTTTPTPAATSPLDVKVLVDE